MWKKTGYPSVSLYSKQTEWIFPGTVSQTLIANNILSNPKSASESYRFGYDFVYFTKIGANLSPIFGLAAKSHLHMQVVSSVSRV